MRMSLRPALAMIPAIAQLVEHLTVGVQLLDGPWFDSGSPDFTSWVVKVLRAEEDLTPFLQFETREIPASSTSP